MQVIPLASSSKGNAYLVADGQFAVLIDCGLSYRELGRRLKERIGIATDAMSAILITHSHSDHVAGLSTLLKHHDVPIYANAMTAEAIISDQSIGEDAFVCFENGQEFELGPLTVTAFSIPHDTSDPVGYLIRGKDGVTYFHGTDIGTPLDAIGLKLSEADIATLESNHDPVMLRNSGRAFSLIQRIAGPRGHLSNDEAADMVVKYASPRLKRLMLAHLSQDCNAPSIAERTMREALGRIGRDDVELEVLSP